MLETISRYALVLAPLEVQTHRLHQDFFELASPGPRYAGAPSVPPFFLLLRAGCVRLLVQDGVPSCAAEGLAYQDCLLRVHHEATAYSGPTDPPRPGGPVVFEAFCVFLCGPHSLGGFPGKVRTAIVPRRLMVLGQFRPGSGGVLVLRTVFPGSLV